jgi:choline dehydrogenase-like flavoprotein
MGPDGDDRAVVDPRGRVYGMEQLYVADASVMPTIPSANTNLPTIMVAERIAAWLAESRAP